MSFTLRKVAGAAVLAVAASALTLPFATPASAVAPAERVWSVVDTNSDGTYGLYYDDGAGPVKVEESDAASINNLSASADGSRVIYSRLTYVPAIDDFKQEIVVRDMSTRFVRVLTSVLDSSLIYPDLPLLSPDGTRAVWEEFNDNTGVLSVRKALVASGAASTLISGYSPYAFVSNDTVLFQTAAGETWTLPFTGGTKQAASGIPLDAINLTVSPDGSKVAWGLMTATTAPYASTMQVAPLTLTSGVASVGSATSLDNALYNKRPAFSRDGAKVYWIKTSGAPSAAGDVWSAPADGLGTAAAVATTTTDDLDVAVTSLPSADVTAPAAAGNSVAALLNGTAATIHWTLPGDSDLSGIVLSRKLGSTVQKNAYIPAPVTSYVDSGLVIGAVYTYTFTTVDRAGNLGPAVTRNVMALKAAPTFADPTSNTSVKAPFPVAFGPSSSGKWYVDYVPTGSTTWRHWVVGAAGRTRTFGSAAATNVFTTTSTIGANYAFRVKVQDSYGNATAFVSSARAVVPFDQTKATLVGGTNVSTAAAYLGSYRRLSKATDYAKIAVVGNRLQVIGWKCTTCGAFAIYDGNTLIATVDTKASSTLRHVVLYTRTYSGSHVFTIRPKATAGRPYVYLDGFGMRR